jgi:WD40 repeat protein
MRLSVLLYSVMASIGGFVSVPVFAEPVAVQSKAQIVTQLGHTQGVTGVAFSADGRLALSGTWDKTLKL